MNHCRNQFREPAAANVRSVSRPHINYAALLTLRRHFALRASWEVCPKHQNSRREIQRVRGRGSQRHALLRPPGRGSRSLRYRLSGADVRHAPRSPGGFWVAVIFFHMKPTDADPNAPKRAAAYVRMSTEHQQYSTLNQLDLNWRNQQVTQSHLDVGYL